MIYPAIIRAFIDVNDYNSQFVLSLNRGDSAKQLQIFLTVNGERYNPGEYISGTLTAVREDGEIIPLGICQYLQDGRITYDVDTQLTGNSGKYDCQLVIKDDSDGSQIACARFRVIVEDLTMDTSNVAQSSEFVSLQGVLDSSERLLNDLTSKRNSGYFNGNGIHVMDRAFGGDGGVFYLGELQGNGNVARGHSIIDLSGRVFRIDSFSGNSGAASYSGITLHGKDGATFWLATVAWGGTTTLSKESVSPIEGKEITVGDFVIYTNSEMHRVETVTTSSIVVETDGVNFKGAPGDDGHTPTRGTDYWTATDKTTIKNELLASVLTQEAGESESLIMSQKAVTDLVNDALGTDETEYETVNSVEEMLDTSKSYILSGTIWSYGARTQNVNKEVFADAATYARNGHMSTTRINPTDTQTLYMIPVDVSGIGTDVEITVSTNGLYKQADSNYTTPRLMKIGYSANSRETLLSTLASATSAVSNILIGSAYANDVEHSNSIGTTLSETETGVDFIVGYIGNAKLSAYNNIKTMLFEVQDTHTASDIEVYVKYTATVNEWYDTGLSPESTGGGNYVDLLVKVNQHTDNITELSNRVTLLETGEETVTIPSFWEDAVTACVEKIKALQVGRNCITFPFFSDNHQRNGYAGVLIAKVMKECGIPYAFFGGDTISSGYIASESVMIAQDKAFDNIMSYIPNSRFCRAVGNHDGFWKTSDGEAHSYTREQVYENFIREEGLAQNKHFGGDGTYYYIDDIASKVRFIILNTNGFTIQGGKESVDETQLSWFESTALSVDEGWGVVVISHCPISNHYHANVQNAEDVISVVKASGADIIGWFSGHIHRDRMYTHLAVGSGDGVEGTDGIELGFTQVTITSDHTSIAYEDATKHTVANDDQSHAVDFVTINRNTRTVNITRLGIGEDRSYTY